MRRDGFLLLIYAQAPKEMALRFATKFPGIDFSSVSRLIEES
jgi:hypothetical protein